MNQYKETGKVFNVGGGFKIPMTVPFKTCEEWNASGKCMDEFLSVGDAVDDDFVDYFLGCVPPKTCTKNIIQIGEPSDTDGNGHFTYSTVKKFDDLWRYVGDVTTERAKTCNQWGIIE